jgi:hypothetical protein
LMLFSPSFCCCGVDMLKHIYLNTKKTFRRNMIITQPLVRGIPRS